MNIMLRSALRGDRKCIFFFVISIVLFLLSINIISAESCLSESKCNFCPGVYQETPKSYTLQIEGVMNCEDGSLSELNGETKLVQYTQDWGACLYSNSGRENGYPIGTELHISNYNGFGINVISGDTLYFKFNPSSCSQEMETDFISDISCDSPVNENPLYVYGGHATLTPCKVPVIENLTIYPEYDSEKYTNRTNLTYEEIFPDNKLKPYANLTIIYSDGTYPEDDEEFTINYTINFTYPVGLLVINTKTIEGQKTCSKNCKIEIPEEDVKQDTLISVEAQILNSGPDERKTAYRYTPYFNLVGDKIRAMNILEDANRILVADKTLGVRAWIMMDSYVRKRNADGTTIGFNEYIDSVNNVKIDLYFDAQEVSSVPWNLTRYGNIYQLKGILSNLANSREDRLNALLKLQKFKSAKDSVNIQGLFPPKDKTGKMDIGVHFNVDKKINEYSYSENENLREEYNLVRQLMPLKVIYVTVGFSEVPSSTGTVKPSASAATITQLVNKGHNLLLETYPVNPAQVSNSNGNPIQSYFPVYLSPGDMEKLRDPTKSSINARDEAFRQLQKLGDKIGVDLVYGIVNDTALNYEGEGNDGINGMFKLSRSTKTVLISDRTGTDEVMIHEATHRFVYTTVEPWNKLVDCGDPQNMYYIPSSSGWCLNQKTGQSCDKEGFALNQQNIDSNKWGINVALFNTPDVQGCYGILDIPESQAQQDLAPGPTSIGNRKPDIMTSSGQSFWVSERTYSELKKVFLGV